MSATVAGLGRFEATQPGDQSRWDEVAAFVATQPRAFTRDASIGGHVTGSAFVLSGDLSSVLLTHHAKLNIWIQLGGHCDGIADAAFTAHREAYEESGLTRISFLMNDVFDVGIHEIPARGNEPAHLHYHISTTTSAF